MLSVNLTLDIYNIAIDFIILLAIYSSGINETSINNLNRTRKWYHIVAIINLVMSGVDIFFRLFDGHSQPINYSILPVAAFLYYASAMLLFLASAKCIEALLDRVRPLKTGRRVFYGVLLIALIAFSVSLVITPFTGLLYKIDENNIYSRGDYFYVALAIQGFVYAGILWLLHVNRRTIHPLKIVIIVFFLFFPQLAQIIQLVMPGISLINTGFSLVFVIMFIFSNSFAEGELKNAENEIQDKSTEIEKNKLKISEMRNHIIESLSNLVENRDETAKGQIDRARQYVELISSQLRKGGYYKDTLTQDYIKLMERAVPVYDIGKIVLSDSILKKDGPLLPEEQELFQRHTYEGGRILKEILGGYENPEYIQVAVDMATYHHEKWNGSGYPEKLPGEAIPLCARIMAVADFFDSMVSTRNKKSRKNYDEAFRIIEEGIGNDFDPAIAREFLKVKHKAIEINEKRKSSFRL